MTSHPDEHEHVANPDRTRVDDEEDLTQSTKDTEHEHDPHDQPWPKVADEVRDAVRNADGPLES